MAWKTWPRPAASRSQLITRPPSDRQLVKAAYLLLGAPLPPSEGSPTEPENPFVSVEELTLLRILNPRTEPNQRIRRALRMVETISPGLRPRLADWIRNRLVMAADELDLALGVLNNVQSRLRGNSAQTLGRTGLPILPGQLLSTVQSLRAWREDWEERCAIRVNPDSGHVFLSVYLGPANLSCRGRPWTGPPLIGLWTVGGPYGMHFKMLRESDGTPTDGHPHARQNDGTICFGTANETIIRLGQNRNVTGVFDLIRTVHGQYDTSPFWRLEPLIGLEACPCGQWGFLVANGEDVSDTDKKHGIHAVWSCPTCGGNYCQNGKFTCRKCKEERTTCCFRTVERGNRCGVCGKPTEGCGWNKPSPRMNSDSDEVKNAGCWVEVRFSDDACCCCHRECVWRCQCRPDRWVRKGKVCSRCGAQERHKSVDLHGEEDSSEALPEPAKTSPPEPQLGTGPSHGAPTVEGNPRERNPLTAASFFRGQGQIADVFADTIRRLREEEARIQRREAQAPGPRVFRRINWVQNETTENGYPNFNPDP